MNHSLNHDIDKQLKTLILNTANDNPAPILGTVNKISDDGRYIDVNLRKGGTLPSVKLFSGEPSIGKEVLLIFIEGDRNEPRAFIENYTPRIPCYNLLENGNFSKFTTKFEKWTGGTKSTNSYYGTNSCELKPNTTLSSDLIDVTLLDDEEAFTVSFLWIGEGFSLEVLDQNNNLISALPSVLGTVQKTGHVDKWSFQRYNYNIENVSKIKVRFSNTSTKSSYLDGIRVWKPDDYQEWFPHKNDKEV